MRDGGVDQQADADDRHPKLGPDQQAAAFECIREHAADQRQRHERHELDERDGSDRERGTGQLVDLVRKRDLDDTAAEILCGLSQPEPAERRVGP